MAKKQTIASEIGSAIGAAAGRAEQLITSNPTQKTTKPAAKRTVAAKHSATSSKKTSANPEIAPVESPISEQSMGVVTRELIAEQAYLYWEARGFQGGNADEDWARAEHELQHRTMAANA